jgi:hypothetical protein
MAKHPYPTPEDLKRLIDYNPDTGELKWKETRNHLSTKGTIIKGSRKDGYVSVCVFGYSLLGHRVAYAIYHGAWPSHTIDHIDSNPSNNVITNLRAATMGENSRNVKWNKANKSGHKGVSWCNTVNKWHAQISHKKTKYCLGKFSDINHAIFAVRQKRQQLHEEFSNHGFQGEYTKVSS